MGNDLELEVGLVKVIEELMLVQVMAMERGLKLLWELMLEWELECW